MSKQLNLTHLQIPDYPCWFPTPYQNRCVIKRLLPSLFQQYSREWRSSSPSSLDISNRVMISRTEGRDNREHEHRPKPGAPILGAVRLRSTLLSAHHRCGRRPGANPQRISKKWDQGGGKTKWPSSNGSCRSSRTILNEV